MIARLVEVISIDDSSDGRRIKVRLKPEDNHLKDSELPDAFPLLPKTLHIMPKVGESVLVFNMEEDEARTQRFYIGPIISQDNHMYYEPYELDATRMFIGSRLSPDVAQSLIPSTEGAYPDKKDVSIQGRKNSDVILTENDVRVRAGVKVHDEDDKRKVAFNNKSGGFILLRYNPEEQYADNDNYHSTAAIVADKVLLLGNSPKKSEVITADKEELITDEKMKQLIEKAHELPYGDKLIEFLNMFRDAFISHVHPFPTMKPCNTEQIVNLKKYDLTKIISDSVRIN